MVVLTSGGVGVFVGAQRGQEAGQHLSPKSRGCSLDVSKRGAGVAQQQLVLSSKAVPSGRRGKRRVARASAEGEGPHLQPARGRVGGHGRRAGVACSAAAEGSDGASTSGRQRRVVVTGLGVVSCLGDDVPQFYERLLSGESGVGRITEWDAETLTPPTTIGGEIKGYAAEEKYVDKKSARRLDDYLKYALVAGKKAVEDAGLDVEDAEGRLDKQRAGILVGSAMGGMQVYADAVSALNIGPRKMSPFCIPFSITNMGSSLLAIDLGYMGPNYPINTACATGNYTIYNAAEHIFKGDSDVMLAGGSDAACIPTGIAGFIACKALSKRNDDPQSASRPWDKGRDGFVMGEGAGVLVLEELEHAKARGARIYAEYIGGAVTCDAHHMTEPQPEGKGVGRCIELAMANAGVTPADVTYINAHATSTPAGDMAEVRAIKSAFKGEVAHLKVNATKSMLGHSLGAAGALEAVVLVKALETGWLHPSLNLENPEPEIEGIDTCAGGKVKADPQIGLSNSFGFGGHNSAVIFKRWNGE